MDADKLVESLAEGDLGEHIRELFVGQMIVDLAEGCYDDDREWADGVAAWLEDRYL